jgi:branched-chain amino acid transport system substrate-binding protein
VSELRVGRLWKGVLIAVGLGAAVLLLAACGGGGSSSTGSETSAASTGEEASAGESASSGGEPSGEPIVFGDVYGPPAAGGKGVLQGMEIAANQLNEEGGIDGRPVELKALSTDASPEAVAAAYRELGQDPSVMGVSVGFIGTPTLRALSETVKLPVISASGNDEIDIPASKYVFGNSFSGEYATAAVTWGVKNKGVKKIAIIHYESPSGQSKPPAIEKRCEELGCELVDVEEGLSTDSAAKLEPALTKMRASGAEMYFIEGQNPNGFKAAETLGMLNEGKVIVSDNWLTAPVTAKACGKPCEGVWFATSKVRLNNLNELEPNDPVKPIGIKYKKQWAENFPKEEFNEFSTYGYDEVASMAFAAEKGVKNGEEISRDSIAENLQHFSGKEFLSFDGYYESSPEDHRLVPKEFSQGYIGAVITLKGNEVIYSLAPDSPASGAEA